MQKYIEDMSYQKKHIFMLIPRPNLHISKTADPYSLSELIIVKNMLNTEKSMLDMYRARSLVDSEFKRKMLEFQNIIDTYKPLRAKITREFGAQPVTNAWMKYWELYKEYDFVPKKGSFFSFFNAELPGAALCAFNHFMKTERPDVNFDWRASSLMPAAGDNNNALGDTYGLYAKNQDKWLMSRANNGDATNIDNILDFAARVGPNSSIGGVDLYSHDAGMDTSTDYNNQELINAKLHLGCAISGLLTLKIGGTFIAKQYTLFETFTWNLILIYAQLFDEFYLCKPLTSRPYNSEIYLIGKKFRGIDDETKDILIGRLIDFNTAPFLPDAANSMLMSESIGAIVKFARNVFGQQTRVLQQNMNLMKKYETNLGRLRARLVGFKAARIDEWLKFYPVAMISGGDNLPSTI